MAEAAFDKKRVTAPRSSSPETVSPEHVFTPAEQECMHLITDFWNMFQTMPHYHPQDLKEVLIHVHALQEKLLVRHTQRVLGWIRLADGTMVSIHPDEKYVRSQNRWVRK